MNFVFWLECRLFQHFLFYSVIVILIEKWEVLQLFQFNFIILIIAGVSQMIEYSIYLNDILNFDIRHISIFKDIYSNSTELLDKSFFFFSIGLCFRFLSKWILRRFVRFIIDFECTDLDTSITAYRFHFLGFVLKINFNFIYYN